MDFIVIEGVPPYDGRHEFDIAGQDFTTREWGWLKRLSGYLPMTVDEGFRGGDPELFCAFAVIALHRANKVAAADVPDVFARLTDSPFVTTIRLESDTADDAEEPEPDPSASSPGNGRISGTAGSANSGTSDATPPPTGTRGLDSSAFDREKSPT